MNKAGAQLPFGIPRDLGVMSVSMFIWGFGEGLFIYFYPLALQRWDSDPVLIGAVLSGLGVAMALVQIPAGYLSDRFGSLPLIRAASILGVLAAAVMAGLLKICWIKQIFRAKAPAPTPPPPHRASRSRAG